MVLYFFLAALLATHCYRNSAFDIDLLSYAGNVALVDAGDSVGIHKIVYGQSLTPHLLGTDANDIQARILRKRASDPYYSALYLPYFSVKPLYVLAMQGVHLMGANVVDSNRIVSAISFFGIAIAVWLYTQSWVAGFILLLPEIISLGEVNGPDALSVALLLLGFWLVFIKEAELGILPVVISVWVRPDDAIAAAVVIVALYFQRRLRTYEVATLLACVILSTAVISHFGNGWKGLYFHTFLGGGPDQVARFGARDYVRALIHGVRDLLHSSVPIYALLGLITFRHSNKCLRQTLVLCAVFSGIRFLVFPSYEPRFFGFFFVIVAVASASALLKRQVGTHSAIVPIGSRQFSATGT